MIETVKIAQDGESYRVYLNMEKKNKDTYIALESLRKLPHNLRRYNTQLRYWVVSNEAISLIISKLIREGIPYTLDGSVKIDPVQTAIDDRAFMKYGKCLQCHLWQSIYSKTGLCFQCTLKKQTQ
jgi:hypothetical protein